MRLRSSAFIFIATLISGASVRSQVVQSRALGYLQESFHAQLEGTGAASHVKCGTPLLALAIKNWASYSTQTQAQLRQTLQRQDWQKSRLSPTGRFRIHYDTTGVNTPALLTTTGTPQRLPNSVEQYVDSVAAIFEHCWDVEVQSLGYAAPPSDGTQGGGSEYDIYISELGTSTFGSTWWAPGDSIPGGATKRFPTYIEIDNDYLGYRTSGMNGLKVTAAHEFFHAIQLGGYGYWESSSNSSFKDSYFYELSSGWMEDVVYSEVNDYYFDVRQYLTEFRDSQKRSYSLAADERTGYFGYERALWAHFLTKRFGIDVLKNIWTGIRSAPFLASTIQILHQRGTDLETEFALFSYWNYFTADRADTVRFYPEGKYYPRFSPNGAQSYNGFQTFFSTSGYPLSTQFFQVALSGDTVTALVTNVDVDSAKGSSFGTRPFTIEVFSEQMAIPYQKLSKGVYAGFSGDIKAFKVLYLNSSTKTNASVALEPSPNPLRLQEAERLTLPVSGTRTTEAEVTIFSSSLDRVFARQYPITELFDKQFIIIPSQDLQGRVASGIYFIYAQCDDVEFHWKVAIVQ